MDSKLSTLWDVMVCHSSTCFIAVTDLLKCLLAHKFLPTLESNLTTHDGQPGWLCSFYNLDGQGNTTTPAVATFVLTDTRIKLNDFLPPGLGADWRIKLTGKLTFDKTAEYELGLTVAGAAAHYICGVLLTLLVRPC